MQRGIEKLDLSFEPSMKILARIMRVILEKNCVRKTSLSQEANIHYTRLLKHLDWLEEKQLIESMINNGSIGIKITSKGKEFATLISAI